MKKRLFSVKELKFQEAVKKGQAMEIADKSTKALQGPEPVHVNQVSFAERPSKNLADQKRTTSVPCYRWGKSNQAPSPSSCCFIKAPCYYCKKKGHIATAC